MYKTSQKKRDYSRERSRRLRLNPEVRRKHNEETKAWRLKNPGHHKQWRDANADSRRTYGRLYARKYRKQNRDKVNATRRAYRANPANRELELKKRREWYRADPSVPLAKTNQWKRKNRDHVLEYNAQRRAKKISVTVADCTERVEQLKSRPFCHYCCGRLTVKNRTVDHVIPLSRGGKHCPDNLVAACKSCNCSKGTRLLSEWTWRMAA